MRLNHIENIRIAKIATAVPTRWELLEDLAKSIIDDGSFSLEKFNKKIGVNGRYRGSEKQTTSDLCEVAAKRIFREKGIVPEDVGVLVFVTQSADYQEPATACILQKRLGLSNDCIAFDVNLGCSGFVNGINIVASLLNTTNSNKGLLLCGDMFGRYFYPDKVLDKKRSHASKFLFGDAGTATLLEKTEEECVMDVVTKVDGDGYKSIIIPGAYWRHPYSERVAVMDDIAVFNFSTEEVPIMLNEYMGQKGRTPSDYDGLVLHQANLVIMKRIAKKTGFSMDNTLISIDVFGNTSSASIPTALTKYYGEMSGTEKKRFLTCGYGVGLSWAAMEIDIAPDDILPLEKTDYCFNDGYSNL